MRALYWIVLCGMIGRVLAGCAALDDSSLSHAEDGVAQAIADTNEIADKLQQAINVEKALYAPAREVAFDFCRHVDPESAACVQKLTILDQTDQAFARAQSGVDMYRKTGAAFDDARNDIHALLDAVAAARKALGIP